MGRRWINVRKGILRATLPTLRLLPPRVALRLVGEIGRLEYRLVPAVRASFDDAINRHAAHFGTSWNPRLIGPELAANQVRSRARDLLIDGRSDAQFQGVFRVEGRELLDEAVGQGKGVILMGNHFGAHLLMACWMIRQGYPWRMLGERPRHISKLLAAQFATDGPTGQARMFISRRTNPSEAAGAILRASRVLRDGIVLSIAADVRWPTPPNSPGTFLGRSYTFSSTWVTLAALSGAPVVPAFCAIEPQGTYAIEFAEPFHVPSAAARDSGLAATWVQHGLDLIEHRVGRDPANSIDYFFWDAGETSRHRPDGATMAAAG